MNDCKACPGCNQVKPLTQFYPLPTSKDGYQYLCKPCHVKRYTRKFIKQDAGRTSEHDVMITMRQAGHYVVPGKASEFKYVDLVAWGCIRIDAKTTQLTSKGYSFSFSPKQVAGEMQSDFVVLVCVNSSGKSYHVFPSNHPAFFVDGRHKTKATYQPGARHWAKSSNVLTDDLMDAHQDAWHLIEQKRLEIAKQLLLK